MISPTKLSHPKIRSFIRRQGRATSGQKYALDKMWSTYGLDPDRTYDFAKVFGRVAPLIIEIGFGNGSCLAEMAEMHPEFNYLGIEVHRPGVGHLMLLLEQKSINNVRIYHHDAIEIMEQKIADNSVMGIHLFFPDPWQKRKHHKRRIVRPDFVALVNNKLESGGYFHAATDWEHYAKDMLTTLSAANGLANINKDKSYCKRSEYRPLTKFENRGLCLGHRVWDLIFKKI